MRPFLLGVLLVVASLSVAPVSAGPSFPCDKAQSRAEKAICADAELCDLDDLLRAQPMRVHLSAALALSALLGIPAARCWTLDRCHRR